MYHADQIRNKIRALLNKTIENGCTEDEQDAAMRMAAAMMAKHGIDQSSLGGKAATAGRGQRINQNYQNYQLILAMAAATLYGCKTIMYSGSGKTSGLEFVGREDNIDASENTFFWLLRQVEHLYKSALSARSGMTQKQRGEYRRTFKDNCAARVNQRVNVLIEEMSRSESAASATGSTALVVRSHFETLRREAEEVIDLVCGKRRGKMINVRQGSGSSDGFRAGDRVQLRREVAS